MSPDVTFKQSKTNATDKQLNPYENKKENKDKVSVMTGNLQVKSGGGILKQSPEKD